MNQDNSENNMNTDKDNQTKKTVLKGVRVSEEAHKILRRKSFEEEKSIREIIDELLDI